MTNVFNETIRSVSHVFGSKIAPCSPHKRWTGTGDAAFPVSSRTYWTTACASQTARDIIAGNVLFLKYETTPVGLIIFPVVLVICAEE